MPHRILLVDPEPAVREGIERVLRQEGFHVLSRTCGKEALHVAAHEMPDLMILDLHILDVEPHEICRIIRETPQARTLPILTVSGRDTDGQVIRCLNSGADGFLHKSVGHPELIAHIRAMLRRPQIYLGEQDIVKKGRMTLRLGERRILFDNKDVFDLTPKEYELLKELVLRAPRIVERTGLVLKVWGVPFEQLGRKTLDVHIQRLRRKLGVLAAAHLKTISLVGYQWLESAKT